MRGALVQPGLFGTPCRGWAERSVEFVTVLLGKTEHWMHVLMYAAIVFMWSGCVCVCARHNVSGLCCCGS